MNRRVILLGAGVVLVVAIVLAIKISSSDSSTKPAATPDATAESLSPKPRTSPKPAGDATKPDRGSSGKPTASDYVETEVNGVTIRDHRKNPGEPFQMPPTVRQHGPLRLPSNIVGMLSNSLQGAMKECTASLAADSKGAHPALEAELFVDIKDKKLTVTESKTQLLDVTGETAAIKQCFEQKSMGHTLPAGSQEDGSHYAITLTYHLQK